MGNALLSLLFQPPDTSHIYPAFKRNIMVKKSGGGRVSCNYLDFGHEHTILFSHGNAEDIKLLSPWFERYICEPLKVNVMLYDYSGYGMSDGECSESNVYEDIEAVYLFLRNDLNLSPQNIILFGRSLGTGATTYLAAKYASDGFKGVILQTPMLSIFRISFNFRFTLPGDMFANIDRVEGITAPTLIIHGTRDEVIPFWHGQKLFSMLKNPVHPLFIDGGCHNNLETDYEPLLLSKISSFIFALNIKSPYPSHPNLVSISSAETLAEYQSSHHTNSVLQVDD